eukprot:7660157-Pyramimonas_sp.AAC.1
MAAPPQGRQKSRPGPILERSSSALGRSRGRLRFLSGPSRGRPGPSWSRLGASDGRRRRMGEKAKSIDSL